MGFMRAYKHLDNLCRDTNGIGLSGYIEDMERNHIAAFRVEGWENDYRQLKHYRWVRNRITHEDNADEDNMCKDGDVEWLEDFYSRMMNQTDPLSLARKASAPPAPRAQTRRQPSEIPVYRSTRSSRRQHTGFVVSVLIALTVIALIGLILLILFCR